MLHNDKNKRIHCLDLIRFIKTIVVEKMRIIIINYAAKPHQSASNLNLSDLFVVHEFTERYM